MAHPDVTDPLLKRARRLARIAQLRLFWERFAPVFAVSASFIIVFLIGSFSGIWERIGDPWRIAAGLAAFYVIFKAARMAAKIRRPSRSEARRRVEHDSGARHRPLDTLEDRPAISEQLWPAHYQKARAAAQKLDAPLGRAVLAPKDPYYLRYILPAALGLSLMVGAGDNIERLRRSLTPVWQQPISPNDVTFEAWVDPPDYTGRPPIYFKNQTQIDIPAGSELVARISGAKNATRLKLTTTQRSRYLPLARLGPKNFEARSTIKERTIARWRVGTLEKKWAIMALPDTPPEVSFNINPRADKRDRLVFTYSFKDDYGVENLSLQMRLLSAIEGFETVSVPLASQSVRVADFDKTALDMTKHRWAGKKVAACLIVKDGLGQMAETDEVYFTIPDKIFVEPLAKTAIEQRSLVMAGWTAYQAPPVMTRRNWAVMPWFDTFEPEQRLGRAAPSVQRAAALIDAVTDMPEGLFEDPSVYLGLKNVLSRLRYAREIDALAGVPEDLWNIAIRAEYGVLGTALEDMREAERALRDGIARRAPQREVDTLFDRYNEAVDRYMDELRRKAAEEGNIVQGQDGSGQEARNMDEIQALLKAIEEANRIGDTEGARRALAKLAQLLENMEIQLSAGGSGGEGDPSEGEMSEEMKKSLEDLADLLGEQRELKDETEQADQQQGDNGEGQGQSDPGAGAPSQQELAQRQKALQDSLDKLSENMPLAGAGEEGQAQTEGGDTSAGDTENGEQAGGTEDEGNMASGGGEPGDETRSGAGTENPGEALADAERAMNQSREALGRGDLEGAARAQSQVITALRRTGQGLAEQVQADSRENGQEANGGGNTDPLGRNEGDQNDEDSEANIDQRDNASRSRELLEELRRRAAEQEREESERQYLERLLKRF